jgi:hypothetical protein
LVWKGWTAKDSLLLVAPHVALPLRLTPFFFSFFFVVPVLLFHSSTHTIKDTHTKAKERKEKKKPKEE